MTKKLVRQHGPALAAALLIVVAAAGLLHTFELRLSRNSPAPVATQPILPARATVAY